MSTKIPENIQSVYIYISSILTIMKMYYLAKKVRYVFGSSKYIRKSEASYVNSA